jgi:hypothetical protein
VEFEFSGEIWFWRGPAPHHFVTVPEDESLAIEATSPATSYGWGCIPVSVTLGSTDFTTSLFPKDGGYIVPIKAAVRRGEDVDLGDTVTLRMRIEA